jgi:CIC family chloride channel protein
VRGAAPRGRPIPLLAAEVRGCPWRSGFTARGCTLPEEAQRQRRLILDTLLLGVAGALASQLFMLLLRAANWLFLVQLAHYQPPGLPNEGGTLTEVAGRYGMWLVPVATTLGGFLVGLLIYRFAPETEGHGTDTAIRSFHRAEGALRARVPPVKMIASALTIGSGGSAGREGPVALIVAGIGSWYASITGRDNEDRRLLMVIGMSAGLAAIFRSPVGTALFAIEVLYSEMEFETGALLYTMLASIVAYAVNGVFSGFRPLFRVPALDTPGAADFAWFAVLGLAAGLAAAALPQVFYGTRDLFRRLKVWPPLRPAIGGLLVGLIAIPIPQILGGGYGWMQDAIDGKLLLGTLLLLVFAKMVAMSLSVSSGGSGGVFAPSLFVGTMLGAFFGAVFHKLAAPFAVVGMAAVFAGAARVPMASLMMVTEMTGGYTLLVPAALAVTLSYLVMTWLRGRLRYRSLYQEQVPKRSDSPAHHSEHLAIALRILEQRQKITGPLDREHGELLAILRSGLAAELPGDRRLLVGVLRADSAYVNRAPAADGGKLEEDVRVVTIIRGEHMMVPRPDVTLQAGDRLILLTTSAGLERLKGHVDKW